MRYERFRKKLEAMLAGKLDEREAKLLKQHVESCNACRLILKGVKSAFNPSDYPQPSSAGPGSVNIPGYRIVSLLGHGGMGEVYHAVQVSMERDVALKVLSAKLAENETFIQRFEREARSAGRLSHNNLIRVYDFGRHGDTYYYSMEYIEGPTVDQEIKKSDRIEQERALEIAASVAEALEYAGDSGLIHRDIKPENIMIAKDGCVKVADMGLVKQVDDSGEGALTMAGERLGTPYYMSPEQIRETKNVDHRADIYSLGASLFHMVTGRRPYIGKTPVEIMQNVLKGDADFNDEERGFLHDSVMKLIMDLMEKNQRQRIQRWKVVRRRIDTVLKRDLRERLGKMQN